MKNIIMIMTVCVLLFCGGCSALRLAPDDAQMANAYLLGQSTRAAANLAAGSGAGETLCRLTELSAMQSEAVAEYYGVDLPDEPNMQHLLSEEAFAISGKALHNAANQNPMKAIGGILEAAIGICGVVGGAFGIKAAAFLTAAKEKAFALQEIIYANEDFKNAYPQYKDVFKQAQAAQSPATKKIVTEIKGAKT